MAPKNIPRCRYSEDLESHRECGIRPREKATRCLDCQGQSEPSKLPHCHTPTSIQVISLDHFHYYLVTMLAFPIRVSGEIKDEPWGSDDDKSEPPPPIPELIKIQNELSKAKMDQSKEGVRKWQFRCDSC